MANRHYLERHRTLAPLVRKRMSIKKGQRVDERNSTHHECPHGCCCSLDLRTDAPQMLRFPFYTSPGPTRISTHHLCWWDRLANLFLSFPLSPLSPILLQLFSLYTTNLTPSVLVVNPFLIEDRLSSNLRPFQKFCIHGWQTCQREVMGFLAGKRIGTF